MKNNIILLFVIFNLGLIFSCDTDLDVDPVGAYATSNFFRTDEQVYEGLIAAYDPIGWSMAFGNWITPTMFGEIRSDNANAGGDPSNNDQPGWQQVDDFNETNTNTLLAPIYRKCYIGIYRTNLVIMQPQFTSPSVERYQAEARFLRAFYHFELFKHFGPMPVVQELLGPEDKGLGRSTMTEMFTAITSDLTAAIDVLPVTLAATEVGRASKGSAQALLGKVYLYWADLDNDNAEKFDLAAQVLGEVVNSGQYALVDDMAELYAQGTKNTTEAVFEIQHSNLWPSGWDWFEGIEGNGMAQLCGIRGLCDSHPTYQAGWGFMLPTQSLYDHFLSDDTYRRDIAIASEESLEAEIDGAGASCSVVVDITQANPIDHTGYWQVKYANFKGYTGNNVNGGDANLTKDPNEHYIRYADVLLMLAEALHRGSGSDAEAMTYIDMVRERAVGPGDNSATFRSAADVMSDEGWDLLEVIWYERRAELAGEGDRWYDLVRSGRANADLFDTEKAANFTDERLFIPIALQETSVASNLTSYPEASLFQ